MPSPHSPPSAYVSGQRGSGKSALIQAWVAYWWACGVVSWVFDPMREHPVPLGGARYRPRQGKIDSDGFDADGPLQDEGNAMAKDAWLRADKRPLVLVYDDVNLVIKGRTGPPHLNLCIHEGRHRNIGFLFSVRRPAETPRDFSSEAQHRVVFRCKELIDLEALHRMGVPKGEAQHLAVGEFFHSGEGKWSVWHKHPSYLDEHGELLECLK